MYTHKNELLLKELLKCNKATQINTMIYRRIFAHWSTPVDTVDVADSLEAAALPVVAAAAAASSTSVAAAGY